MVVPPTIYRRGRTVAGRRAVALDLPWTGHVRDDLAEWRGTGATRQYVHAHRVRRDRSGGAGENILAILFDRPLDHLQALEGIEPWGPNPERIPMRKAQYGYGWDWGPRLPTIGVWRPIELRRERQAVVDGLHVATLDIERGARRAALAVRVEAEAFAHPGGLTARVELVGPEGAASAGGALTLDGSAVARSGTVYLTVEQPRLRWTHDMGDPALYTAV